MFNQLGFIGDQSKTNILPTYVDMELFSAKPSYDFSDPLVTVCRLASQKNLGNLIRACAIIDHPLVIYGSGAEEAALRETARVSGAQVAFAGVVDNAQLAKKLPEHSIFVLPSLHEGLPKALIEAMASGLVCVGSNIDGITDIIEDGVTGHLISDFEPKDIAATLRHIIAEKNAGIGRAARKDAIGKYNIDRYAEKEAAIYAALG